MAKMVAVLLNPPLTSGAASRRHVEAARAALNCDSYEVVNLFTLRTKSVDELNLQGGLLDSAMSDARSEIERAFSNCDLILGAWGISGMTGQALKKRNEQVSWLGGLAQDRGHIDMWSVGGQPRHPSRWHQYVSDKYGRTKGGTLAERLTEVLVASPFSGSGGVK